MRRPAPPTARSFVVGLIAVALLAVVAPALAGVTPENVLVVQNSQSTSSIKIADYYATARHIPWSNICTISCSTSELVSRAECENNIIAPIRAFLQNPAIAGRIDYIVLTKGVPLSADYGYSSGPLSITSILTCVGEPSITAYLENPYGPTALIPVEIAFSHQLDLGGYHLYLVTRLDGYNYYDVYNLIDRSLTVSPLGPVALDQKYVENPSGSDVALNQRLADTNSILMSRLVPTIFDTTSLFLSNMSNLMGYFSWGSNDPSFTQAAYVSNTFVPGSIVDTYVSSSGRTFNTTTGGASLIVDLLRLGACGLCGNVSEPYTAYTTYPDVLWDRYTKGFNVAESFYAAAPMLFWKSVVVGDPMMAPYATVPSVSMQFPVLPLSGWATVGAVVSDPDGIDHVEFFVDGAALGTDATPPYSVEINTTDYPVGPHKFEAKAVDASTAATYGWGSATENIQNPVSKLRRISDAFPSPDGQGVETWPKVVTAGTDEMGGSEFYIEEANGSSGIRVISTERVQEGDVVIVGGSLVTASGERSIDADSVIVKQHAVTPRPWGLCNNSSVGGGPVSPYTRGITGGLGPRNIGLLVKIGGVVTYVGAENEDFFYLDCGTGPCLTCLHGETPPGDGSGHRGIRVRCRNLVKPAVGNAVILQGVSGCELLGSSTIPAIKPRRQSDITICQ